MLLYLNYNDSLEALKEESLDQTESEVIYQKTKSRKKDRECVYESEMGGGTEGT